LSTFPGFHKATNSVAILSILAFPFQQEFLQNLRVYIAPVGFPCPYFLYKGIPPVPSPPNKIGYPRSADPPKPLLGNFFCMSVSGDIVRVKKIVPGKLPQLNQSEGRAYAPFPRTPNPAKKNKKDQSIQK